MSSERALPAHCSFVVLQDQAKLFQLWQWHPAVCHSGMQARSRTSEPEPVSWEILWLCHVKHQVRRAGKDKLKDVGMLFMVMEQPEQITPVMGRSSPGEGMSFQSANPLPCRGNFLLIEGCDTVVIYKTILLILFYHLIIEKKYLETIQHCSCCLLALTLYSAVHKEVELNQI